MVLHVTESKTINSRHSASLRDMLTRHAKHLRPAADALHNTPERRFPTGSSSVLYIHQREFAIIPLDDKRGPLFVGTDEATTCHIVALLSKKRHILAFAHVDGSGIDAFFTDVLQQMRLLGDDLSLGIDVHLVGGFLDSNFESRRVSISLLRWMANSNVAFRLRTAAITDLNDEFRPEYQQHFPRRYGLAIDVAASRAEGQLCLLPASFEAYGPCPELRRTRFCGSDRMSCVYNPNEARLEIQPFDFTPPPGLQSLVRQSADHLRLYSTSPLQERPGFEDRLRSTLQYMLQHQGGQRDAFPDDRPLAFHLVNGDWLPVDQ